MTKKEKINELNKIIGIMTGLMISIAFFIFGLIPYIKERNVIKNYEQTEAKLNKKFACSDNICSASYYYEVNGNTYYILYSQYSTYFKNKETVYYNKEKPEIGIIKSFDNKLFMSIGIIIFIVIVIILLIEKIIKNKNNN